MPSLDSLYRTRSGLWAPYYAILQQELGATATLMDFGNQGSAGLVTASTFTGRRFNASGLAPTWTPSAALSALATPFNLSNDDNWLGLAPILTLNGTSEEADTPDADFWTRNDGAGQGMSIGAWMNGAFAASEVILAKYTTTTANAEWLAWFDTTGRLALQLMDQSVPVSVKRVADTSVVVSTWHFFVITYDGTGGVDAMGTSGSVQDNVTLYVDGAIVASTATDNANYVAMENLTGVVTFAHRESPTGYFTGKVLGGPWSLFFTQAELQPAQVTNLWQNMRLGLGI